MSIKRGMGAIKGALRDSRRSGGFMRYFKLADGESTEVILLGTPKTEPVIIEKHSFRDGKRFSSIGHRSEDCVACYANTNGDKRISRPSPKACFTFFDLAWVRKKRDEERSAKEGRDRFEYKRVEADSVTSKGVRKGIFQRVGKCGWEMPPQWANSLDGVNRIYGKRCKSCTKGKISLVSYFDTKKKQKVSLGDMEPEEIQDMINSGRIQEKLVCSKCDKPIRTSIFNSIVTVTRAGENTNTSYQFGISPDDYPEDVVELLDGKEAPEPYDWESESGEPATEIQAQALGIRNPFGSKGKRGADDDADEYEEEDEDEDDEADEGGIFRDDDEDEDDDPLSDDDDDDDDEPKKKSLKKKSKFKLKR